MGDVVDDAQWREQEDLDRAHALFAARRAAQVMQTGRDCFGCGETIDARRRAAAPGCCLCFACQQAAEEAHR